MSRDIRDAAWDPRLNFDLLIVMINRLAKEKRQSDGQQPDSQEFLQKIKSN